ncbi:Ldh family oxidoreductase [Variovorax sp.]|uniref:Ldh family oxidoreductase n=1 Tax=Variovorax sp. TaxID=1871043 RepID=UPI001383AB63|nr:Ldh family oxidoreductase [Variovorax sp.]KAF1060701.1 MAG: L-lactate dehydrogenase [Variovorax sp.]
MNQAASSSEAPLYNAPALVAYADALLQKCGLAAPMAASVARTLVEGDLLGHDTHGLALLAGYAKELEAGAASLVIRRSHHIACLAVYMLRALQEDMLMLLACSDPNTASVAPFGGTQAVFTPNPLALGFGLSQGGVMVDISASITTNGMSNRKRAAGETFAEQWLIDARGRPSNDPQVLFDSPPGTLLPVGGLSHGHKGYGMALLVEALTGGLAGHGRADPPEGWGATVHVTLHDLHAFGGKAAFLRQMDEVAERCRGNAPIDPAKPVRLPGEGGLKRREAQSRDGVRLHPSIARSLQEVEQRHGLRLAQALAR